MEFFDNLSISSGLLKLIITGVVLFILISFIIKVRNRLVVLKNQYKTSFAQIETELERRYDLIPNLVAVAKQYMTHEQETLTNVIQARNQAQGALNQAKQHLDDGDMVNAFTQAEAGLGSALGRLMAVVEAYPELKANEQMENLSNELSTTEDRIANHRKHYNGTIEEYNNYREAFPNNLVSGLFKYPQMPWLKADEAKREAPKVQF